MKGQIKNLALVALVLVLATVGCASSATPTPLPTPGSATTVFPVGTFTMGIWDWEFRADGTEVASELGVGLREDGKYTVTGNQIVVQDTKGIYCGEPKGIYTWTFDGKVLTFKAIYDPCAERRNVVDGSSYSKKP